MGGGIAMNFVNAGLPVTIIEQSQERLGKGQRSGCCNGGVLQTAWVERSQQHRPCHGPRRDTRPYVRLAGRRQA